MFNVAIQTIKNQYKGVIYYSIGLFGYVWMLLAMYPAFHDKIDIEELMKAYPKEFLKFFGGGDMSLSSTEGFLSMEFLSLFFILIITFYIAASAGTTIAGAIERKTMDFSLSQPISRTKLVLADAIVSLGTIALLTLVTSISIFIFCQIYNNDINSLGLISFSIVATFFLWSIYGIAIFISSFMRSKITVVSTTLIITMGFYIFSSLTRIFDQLKNFDKYSLFYFYDPLKLLKDNAIDWNHIAILSAILLLGLSSSLIIFNRKDI